MNELGVLALVFIIISAVGAVFFAVYYSFFYQRNNKQARRIFTYSFMLYCAFPVSVFGSLLINIFGGGGDSEHMSSSDTALEFSAVARVNIWLVIVFAIAIGIGVAIIRGDERRRKEDAERVKEREWKRRVKYQGTGYINCEYCGSVVEKKFANCSVCGAPLRKLGEKKPDLPGF